MTVYFIGAGPGAADLITVRGLRLIERCPVCLYAGSLVPEEIVASAPSGALVMSVPAREKRQLTAAERAASRENAARYVRNAALYLQEALELRTDEGAARDR